MNYDDHIPYDIAFIDDEAAISAAEHFIQYVREQSKKLGLVKHVKRDPGMISNEGSLCNGKDS